MERPVVYVVLGSGFPLNVVIIWSCVINLTFGYDPWGTLYAVLPVSNLVCDDRMIAKKISFKAKSASEINSSNFVVPKMKGNISLVLEV